MLNRSGSIILIWSKINVQGFCRRVVFLTLDVLDFRCFRKVVSFPFVLRSIDWLFCANTV